MGSRGPQTHHTICNIFYVHFSGRMCSQLSPAPRRGRDAPALLWQMLSVGPPHNPLPLQFTETWPPSSSTSTLPEAFSAHQSPLTRGQSLDAPSSSPQPISDGNGCINAPAPLLLGWVSFGAWVPYFPVLPSGLKIYHPQVVTSSLTHLHWLPFPVSLSHSILVYPAPPR